MTTRVTDLFDSGDHASRPDPATVPVGALYSCTEHRLVYKNDAGTWVTWATLLDKVLLEASGTAANVPAGTPVGTLIFKKGS